MPVSGALGLKPENIFVARDGRVKILGLRIGQADASGNSHRYRLTELLCGNH